MLMTTYESCELPRSMMYWGPEASGRVFSHVVGMPTMAQNAGSPEVNHTLGDGEFQNFRRLSPQSASFQQ